MGSETYERKLTDEFFNSPIGNVVRDAIYNNMTIVCNDVSCFITGGECDTNDTSIIYEPDNNKPVIRTSNVWYHDTLLVENLEDNIDTVSIQMSYNTSNSKRFIYMINGVGGGKPFNLIWTTTIRVNNEPVNTYTRKIKVIPKIILYSKEE